MRELDKFVEVSRHGKDGDSLAARMDASAKMRALETLAKAQGLLTERKEISGPNGGPIPIQSIEVMLDEASDA